MTPCDDTRNQDYVLDLLTEAEAAEARAHLNRCGPCAREVDAYRVLFAKLAELDDPSLPTGIPEAVLAELQPASAWQRIRSRISIGSPVAGILVGGLAGVVLGFFRERILLLLGQATSNLLTGGTKELVDAIRAGIDRILDGAVLVELLISWALKLKPVVRAVGEALPTLAGQTSLLTIALILATALVFGRVVGHFKREDFGHVRR